MCIYQKVVCFILWWYIHCQLIFFLIIRYKYIIIKRFKLYSTVTEKCISKYKCKISPLFSHQFGTSYECVCLPFFFFFFFKHICYLIKYFVCFLFWPRSVACGILVPQPGFEPTPLAVKTRSPNHQTTREFPLIKYLLNYMIWISFHLRTYRSNIFPVSLSW